MTSRDVARILSPGTHVEAPQSENFYLAGMWLDAGRDAVITLRLPSSARIAGPARLLRKRGRSHQIFGWSR